jgi:ketosteroid isomerase-like protein
MDLAEVYEQFGVAADAFAKGDPELVKALYSHSDDATIANPFGPAVRGWDEVSRMLEYASSRFPDGEFVAAERIAEHVTADLACVVDVEHWRSRVNDAEGVEPFDLRVTMTFRREAAGWKLVHRHADPITALNPRGPMRGTASG